MGGQIAAVLGLLCLMSGALLPGEAQEETPNESTNLLSASSVATTSPSFVSSVDLHGLSVSPGRSEFSDTTPGPQVTETERPVPEASTASVPESGSATATMTAAAEEVTTGSESSPSTTSPAPDTREVTSANLTQPTPTTQPAATAAGEDVTTETPDRVTASPSLLSTLRISATQPSSESPIDTTDHTTATTAIHTTWMAAITTSLFITTTVTTGDTTSLATQSTAAPHTTRAEVQRGPPSVLEVGDDKELPNYHSRNSSNPLFVMIVSIFTIMVVMVVVVVGFHRYKKRNSRTEFRRLQDLPMDDMMEDTPLSLYSY